MSSQEPRPTVRRATVLPQVSGEPAAALAPASGTRNSPAAAVPPAGPPAEGSGTDEAAPAAPAAPAASQAVGAPSTVPAPSSAPGEGSTPDEAAPPAAAAEPAAAAATAAPSVTAAPEPATAQPGTAPGAASTGTTTSSAARSSAAAATRSGEARGEAAGQAAAGGETPSRRPSKPMLAAAGLGGTILIGIPFLFMALPGDDKPASSASQLSSDSLSPDDTNAGGPPGRYAPAAPSGSSSPSSKTKANTADKQGTPRSVTGPAEAKPSGRSGAGETKKSGAATGSKAGTKTGGKADTKAARAPGRAGGALPTGVNFSTVTGVLVKNVMTGQCVDLPFFGNGKPDGPVNQFPCNGSTGDNQRWDLVVASSKAGPGGADLFTVRNSKDRYCLDLPYNGGGDAGTGVFEYHCNALTSDNQLWYLDKKSSGKFWIRNYASAGRCLDVGGHNAGNDAPLTIFDCSLGDDHLWSFA